MNKIFTERAARRERKRSVQAHGKSDLFRLLFNKRHYILSKELLSVASEKIELTAFHVLSTRNLGRLINNQNSRRGISASLGVSLSGFRGGIASQGGILAAIHGSYLISGPTDIYTAITDTGIRTFSMEEIYHGLLTHYVKKPEIHSIIEDNLKEFDKIKLKHNEIRKKLVDKYTARSDIIFDVFQDNKETIEKGIERLVEEYIEGQINNISSASYYFMLNIIRRFQAMNLFPNDFEIFPTEGKEEEFRKNKPILINILKKKVLSDPLVAKLYFEKLMFDYLDVKLAHRYIPKRIVDQYEAETKRRSNKAVAEFMKIYSKDISALFENLRKIEYKRILETIDTLKRGEKLEFHYDEILLNNYEIKSIMLDTNSTENITNQKIIDYLKKKNINVKKIDTSRYDGNDEMREVLRQFVLDNLETPKKIKQ